MTRLTTEPLVVQTAIDAVLTDADGAYVLFVGVVRDHSGGRAVTGLEYSAHPPLAEAQLTRLVDAVSSRWGLRAAVLHRYGYIPVGDSAVVVCVASPHRAESFEACRWLIDTIKTEVPIWKKEFAADGAFWIEGSDVIAVQRSDETTSGETERDT